MIWPHVTFLCFQNLKWFNFESLEGIQNNVITEETFRKLLQIIFPGMAETLECIDKTEEWVL
jgi:hypothetical protein